MVAGGTASVIGGGKFANGAYTAAFGYVYNCAMHGGCWSAVTQRLSTLAQSLWIRWGPGATSLAADLAGVNGTLTSPGAVALGHAPDYVRVAKEAGYKYFNAGNAYDAFGGLENNFRFLDYMYERGYVFRLTGSPRDFRQTYALELDYLASRYGMVPNADFTQLVHRSELIPR
jgi:hypothetical protein